MRICIGYGRSYDDFVNIAVKEAIEEAEKDINGKLVELENLVGLDQDSVTFLPPNVNIILEKDGKYTVVVIISANVKAYGYRNESGYCYISNPVKDNIAT